MKGRSIIYMARCTIKPELIYIGKTNQSSLEDRIVQHEQQARFGDSTPFHQAMIDYGLKNWDWSILTECSIENEFKEEKKYIKQLVKGPIKLLNVTYNKEVKNKKKYASNLIKKNRSHKVYSANKSELGSIFERMSGKIKPIINLKTKVSYKSISEASQKDNVPKSTLRLSCEKGKMLRDGTRYAFLDINNEPVLTKGHSKEHYVGERANTRKVKNLISGKIYNNSREAANKYDVSSSTIDGAARGKYLVVKDKYVFCFLDEHGNEILTDRHNEALKKIEERDKPKLAAWHIDDHEMAHILYFKNLNELCKKLEIKNKSHIKSVCEGKRSHAENWRVAYFDHRTEKIDLKAKHTQKIKKRHRRIICLNDNKIFQSGIEAGKHYQLNSSQISKCAGGGAKSVYKGKLRLRFAFLDEDDNPILTKKHKEPLTARGKKRIQRISNGDIFNSLAEYLRKTGLPYKTAKRYLKDQSIDLLGYEFIEID